MSRFVRQREAGVLPRHTVGCRCAAGPLRRRHAGFTLIELLICMAMLLLLFSAVVMYYPRMTQGMDLREGARRLESALRYARAEAALNGRQLRLVYEQEAEGRLKVQWEARPFEAPGEFTDLTWPAWVEQLPNDMVRIERIDWLDMPLRRSSDEDDLDDRDDLPMPQYVTFYPDGSCDSVRFIVASRDRRDEQVAIVQINGMNGNVRTYYLLREEADEYFDLAKP